MRADSFKDGYAILQNFWRKMSILVFSTSDKNQNYKKKVGMRNVSTSQ